VLVDDEQTTGSDDDLSCGLLVGFWRSAKNPPSTGTSLPAAIMPCNITLMLVDNEREEGKMKHLIHLVAACAHRGFAR
jgi:hypothetical protein